MANTRKLLVLLGAGSSIDQGFPSTSRLDDEMKKWAAAHAKSRGPDPIDEFNKRVRTDFFGRLWKNREAYGASYNEEQQALFASRTAPNYERVLGDLHALMNGVLPKPFGDPILRHIARAEVFRGLKIAPERGGLDQHGSNKMYYAVEGQLRHLHQRLADRIRGSSRVFEIELDNGRGERFQPYRGLFEGLGTAFSVGIYNLNYDTVALNARPRRSSVLIAGADGSSLRKSWDALLGILSITCMAAFTIGCISEAW